MIWYKADSAFLQTSEADTLLFEFGMDAIGVYWSLCGIVASAINPGAISYEIKHTSAQLAYKFHMNVDRLEAIMSRLFALGLLHKADKGNYTIPSLSQKLDEYTNRKNKNGQCPDNVPTPSGEDRENVPKDKNRIDKKEKSTKEKKSREQFTPPSQQEVQDYLVSQNILSYTSDQFVDYYASKGWKVGSTSMKDWKAAARNWNRRSFNKGNAPPGPSPYKDLRQGGML